MADERTQLTRSCAFCGGHMAVDDPTRFQIAIYAPEGGTIWFSAHSNCIRSSLSKDHLRLAEAHFDDRFCP